MNRGFTLLVPELHENKEDVDETCKKIVKNISENLWNGENKKIFKALVESYIEYKHNLKKEKIEESENPLCHGSRDFYFLIKNVAYNLLNKKKENNEIINRIEIVKSAIERNFGALYIKDKKSSEKFKEIFLKIYNNDEFNSNKEFKTDKDVIKNIISNIIDKNSRNLLLITKSSLNLLLVNMLREKLEQLYNEKKINLISPIYKIGSSFEEDKGEEYKIKIINQIIDHAKNGDVIIIQNYSKILPFLYELFNLNYSKKDGKNYARLSIGKTREQFIEVNENFKVILLFDKEEVKNISQPTASRFEKIEVDYSNLLDDDEIERAKVIYKIIFNKLTNIKLDEGKNLNYDLNNLIVNLDLEEIQSMIYYCKNNKIEGEKEKKYIFDNITPNLPQDIISCLKFELLINNSDNDIKQIKNIYDNINKINNIENFLRGIDDLKKKFFVIYTFSNLSEQFSVKNNIKIELESSIKNEEYLENLLYNFYTDKSLKIFIFKINGNDSKNIIYLKTFIKSYEDTYKKLFLSKDLELSEKNISDKKFVFIIHIIRKFYSNSNKTIENKINTISYTSTDLQHLFIDNLNGSDKMTLDKIKDNQINDILQGNYNLEEELMSIILDFFEKKIKSINYEVKGINSNNFIKKMENYLQNKGKDIFNKINEIIIDKIKVGNALKEMFEKNYIQNNSVDIISSLINYMFFIYKDYIDKSLEYIENNFFLTTLMVINENNNNKENKINPDQKFIDNEIVKKIIDNYLEMMEKTEFGKDEGNNKICLLYKIPGLYIFYVEINKYIKENIVNEYYKNENDFRKALPKEGTEGNLINKFHRNESNYLERLYNHLYSNDLFNFLFKEKIHNITKEFIELLLYDYTTYFLLNNGDYYPSENDYLLILKLLALRFKDDKDKNESINIIKSNYNDEFKQFLIKILWLESNYDLIMKILEIYNKLSSIFPKDRNKFLNNMFEYIAKTNLRYITNETRNPKHTTEINECFYLILASICQCITNEDILNLFKRDNIYNYINKCNEIFPIILRLSDELLLFLNEKYIIEEFLLFINYANKIDKIDIIDFSKNLLIRLKNSSNIIQKESENNIENLNTCFEDINKYIKNKLEDKGNDEYYDLLSSFYLKELKKLKDTNYRRMVFSRIFDDDKIIQKSLESFKFLLKSFLQPEKFEKILSNFTKKSDDFMQMIENIDSKELDDLLLYLFELKTFLYFENAEAIKDKSLKEKKFKYNKTIFL